MSLRYRLLPLQSIAIIVACSDAPLGPHTEVPTVESIRIAVTSNDACAIERSGDIVCWGTGEVERHRPEGELARFQTITAGWSHFCALALDGAAYCWGENRYGELGDGTAIRRTAPVRVLSDRPFVAIQASVYSSCALDAEGIAFCWGRNEFGAVGDGSSTATQMAPKQVGGQTRYRALGGAWANCGLSIAKGQPHCWGYVPGSFDPNMLIAPGDCTDSYYRRYAGRQCTEPTPIRADQEFVRLAGDRCAITITGEAYCWGDGYYGTFGDGRTGVYSASPVRVVGGIGFQDITSGSSHVCGLDGHGQAYCWGNNFAGQLGIGEAGAEGGPNLRSFPTAVLTDQRFIALSAGNASTCALTSSNEVWCWGKSPQLAIQLR